MNREGTMKKAAIIVTAAILGAILLAACGTSTPAPTVTVTVAAEDSAIEPEPTEQPTESATPTPASGGSWVKVAQMNTTSSEKKGAIFEVKGEKQKAVIKYAPGEYGAGASLYIYAKGDNNQDGYTDYTETEKKGTESSLMYLDPGQYYMSVGTYGGSATYTFYDWR